MKGSIEDVTTKAIKSAYKGGWKDCEDKYALKIKKLKKRIDKDCWNTNVPSGFYPVLDYDKIMKAIDEEMKL